MKKSKIASLAVATGSATLVGSLVRASVQPGSSLSSLQVKEIVILARQLPSFGITNPLVLGFDGELRMLDPDETVKVRVHEEKGVLDFSSFDRFSRPVDELKFANPRNLG